VCTERYTPDDGQRNCPKHVEFYSKNKFEKLVHLGFIIRTSSPHLISIILRLQACNSASCWFCVFILIYNIFTFFLCVRIYLHSKLPTNSIEPSASEHDSILAGQGILPFSFHKSPPNFCILNKLAPGWKITISNDSWNCLFSVSTGTRPTWKLYHPCCGVKLPT